MSNIDFSCFKDYKKDFKFCVYGLNMREWYYAKLTKFL